jgi:hypothetical protein
MVVMFLHVGQPFGTVMQRTVDARLFQKASATAVGNDDEGDGVRVHGGAPS